MTEDAGTDSLHNAVDHPSLTGGVAPFKHNHHLGAGGLHPFLHFDQFGLELTQCFLVFLPIELLAPPLLLDAELPTLISHDLGWRRFTDNCASDRAKAALTDATS